MLSDKEIDSQAQREAKLKRDKALNTVLKGLKSGGRNS